MAGLYQNTTWQGDPKNMAGWSQNDFTTCRKIHINHRQGSTKIFLGRGIPKTWQGGPKMILLDVASHTSIIGRVSTKIFLGRVIPKTWQGGPKMILLDVARCCKILLFYKRYLCLKLDPYLAGLYQNTPWQGDPKNLAG